MDIKAIRLKKYYKNSDSIYRNIVITSLRARQIIDERYEKISLEENIEDSDLGLSFINSLRPVKYNFIEDKHDGKTRYGIIAQEVIEVLEETGNMDFAGIKDDNKEKLGADYTQFIAPLMKAVQELTAKVEALENK